jgi:integrase
MLKAVLGYAVDHEMLLKNPLKKIELPLKVSRTENVLRSDEARKVLETCRTEPPGIFYAFLLWSGWRPNEGAGLQWKDIDWEKGSMPIRRDIV